MRAVLTILACLVLVACGSEAPPPLVGTLERDRIELAAHHAEPVAKIAVSEGEFVNAGDLVARLDSAVMDANLDEARASRDAMSARLAELVRGPRIEAIDEARASLARTEAELERAEHQYRRIQKLRASNLVSESEMDEARSTRDARLARKEEASARLKSLLDGTTVEELDRARADLRAAEARVKRLEVEGSRLVIRAPVAGWIDALPYNVGERAAVGSPVAVLLAADAPYARIYVPELMRARVEPGQAAQVIMDGRTEPLPGRVRFISRTASFTPFFALTEHDRSRLAYLAKVEIDAEDVKALPVGIPVQVKLTEEE